MGKPKQKEKVDWEVEDILSHRKIGSHEYMYKVQWKLDTDDEEDWPEEENWVYQENMKCPDLLRSYWARTNKEGTPLEKKETPKKKDAPCSSKSLKSQKKELADIRKKKPISDSESDEEDIPPEDMESSDTDNELYLSSTNKRKSFNNDRSPKKPVRRIVLMESDVDDEDDSKPSSPAKKNDPECIVLSSDEDGDAMPPKNKKKKFSKTKRNEDEPCSSKSLRNRFEKNNRSTPASPDKKNKSGNASPLRSSPRGAKSPHKPKKMVQYDRMVGKSPFSASRNRVIQSDDEEDSDSGEEYTVSHSSDTFAKHSHGRSRNNTEHRTPTTPSSGSSFSKHSNVTPQSVKAHSQLSSTPATQKSFLEESKPSFSNMSKNAGRIRSYHSSDDSYTEFLIEKFKEAKEKKSRAFARGYEAVDIIFFLRDKTTKSVNCLTIFINPEKNFEGEFVPYDKAVKTFPTLVWECQDRHSSDPVYKLYSARNSDSS